MPASPSRPARRLIRAGTAALLGAAVVAPVVTQAAVSPADESSPTITVTRTDRTGDLASLAGPARRATAAQRAATDLRALDVEVDRVRELVVVTWRVRDLRPVRGAQLFGLTATRDGRPRADGPGIVVDFERRGVDVVSDDFRRCGAAEVAVRWAKDSVVATVPWSCLQPARAAFLKGFSLVLDFERRQPVFLADDVVRTRALPFTTYVAPVEEPPAGEQPPAEETPTEQPPAEETPTEQPTEEQPPVEGTPAD